MYNPRSQVNHTLACLLCYIQVLELIVAGEEDGPFSLACGAARHSCGTCVESTTSESYLQILQLEAFHSGGLCEPRTFGGSMGGVESMFGICPHCSICLIYMNEHCLVLYYCMVGLGE